MPFIVVLLASYSINQSSPVRRSEVTWVTQTDGHYGANGYCKVAQRQSKRRPNDNVELTEPRLHALLHGMPLIYTVLVEPVRRGKVSGDSTTGATHRHGFPSLSILSHLLSPFSSTLHVL
jgi:hypothetical protein